MLYLMFTCAILVLAGLLLAFYVSDDDFEGRWWCIGTRAGDVFVPFPPGVISQEILITDDRAEYQIDGDPMNVTYDRRRLQVDLTAQITMNYRLAIEEGNLLLEDQNGTILVFERIEEEENDESGYLFGISGSGEDDPDQKTH